MAQKTSFATASNAGIQVRDLIRLSLTNSAEGLYSLHHIKSFSGARAAAYFSGGSFIEEEPGGCGEKF